MSLFNRLVVMFLPIVPKPVVSIFAKRYVAGSSLSDAVETTRSLNNRGMMGTMDMLGESAERVEQTKEAVEEYFRVLDTIDKEQLDCNISVKPTQLGLSIDKQLCYENLHQIVSHAAEYNTFVRIDMEDSTCTTDTIELYNRLRDEFENVGVVIQSYMRRSLDDVKGLAERRANLRICKGIYIEPRKIAYKDPDTINANFNLLMDVAFESRCYVGIATHDEHVVWSGLRLVEKHNLNINEYEFQMLLGVDEELRSILVDAGHRLRVYVPYGKQWYPYVKRRLKENPKIAMYVLRALVGLR